MVFEVDLIIIFNGITCYKSNLPLSMKLALFLRLNFEVIWHLRLNLLITFCSTCCKNVDEL